MVLKDTNEIMNRIAEDYCNYCADKYKEREDDNVCEKCKVTKVLSKMQESAIIGSDEYVPIWEQNIKEPFNGQGYKIYISGKMNGIPPKVVEKRFREAEYKLARKNMHVVNPFYMWIIYPNLYDYKNICTAIVEQCDAIYMLDNWTDSPGAKNELATALEHNLEIYFENDERKATK